MESSDHRVPQGSLNMGPVIQLEGYKCNVNGLFFCATREVINGGRIIGDRFGIFTVLKQTLFSMEISVKGLFDIGSLSLVTHE